MNEDLPNRTGGFPGENQANEQDWQAPPPPLDNYRADEPPQMSEVGTLGSVFFEPGRVFEDLRRKPRFITASLICAVLITMFIGAFNSKIGYERVVSERLAASSWFQNQSPEMQKTMIQQQSNPITQYITMAVAPLAVLISFLIGGLIYWGGVNAMGGSMSYLRGVSVWAYSSFPPFVVSMLANLLILFLKSPDDIDSVASQQSLIHANPTFFINMKTMPVLGALLGTFDLFYIWGWILAAIGLRIVGKISTGAAWGIVLLVALLNIASRVVGALFQG